MIVTPQARTEGLEVGGQTVGRDAKATPLSVYDLTVAYHRGVPVYDAPAAGGIYSSADDMAKWIQVQLALGRKQERQVISEKAVREMHAMHDSVPIRNTTKNNPYAARF